MNLLAIDTSTERASVALHLKGEFRSEEQGAQKSHARLILPMTEQLLAEAGLSLGQLDALVFGQGPGSFTGLRIACSVAKGLAYSQDLPLYPVSSLAAIANEAFHSCKLASDTSLLAVLDARMNQLYWGCFKQQDLAVAEEVTAAADIRLSDKSLVLAGVGYEPYLQQMAPELAISKHFTIYPRAEAMIRLVLGGAIKPVSATEALPVYIRNQITQGEPRG